MDLGLSGKTALVLGASKGLGRAIAETLAAEGSNLVIAARNGDSLADLAAKLEAAHGVSVGTVSLDTSNADAVAAFATKIRDEIKPDILLANTGGPAPTTALGTEPGAWAGATQSLLFSMINLIQAAAEGMADRGWGRIVVVGSSGIIQPIPNLAMSNTLRSGIAGFCKTLSAEVAAKGVTVNMVLPGRIHTDRIDELDSARSARTGQSLDDVRTQFMNTVPTGRYGDPAEFAAVAVFLMSQQAAYVTGQMTRVDGGLVQGI